MPWIFDFVLSFKFCICLYLGAKSFLSENEDRLNISILSSKATVRILKNSDFDMYFR